MTLSTAVPNGLHNQLGCNNAKPKCENCYENQKECSYSVRMRKERPSNSRIITLKEENIRLRKELERLQSVPNFQEPRIRDEARQVVASSTLGPLASRSLERTSSNEKQLTKVSQISDQGHSENASTEINSSLDSHGTQFHGPTSAMFDGKYPLERKNVDSIAVVDTSQRAQLLAESARQRQLELINLRSGKLNFDGLDPELGMVLLSVFWNRQHATGSIVYRPCFMRDMASKGPYFSPLLLNTIFFVASKHVASKDGPRLEGSCNSIDNCNSGLLFRRKVDSILHHPETQVLCKSSITTVQALLIMSDALFSWCDERSLSWHYLGIAINMIIDLGIHSEKSTLMLAKSHSPEEMETHRRLFWAAFVLDKVQSIYQGRPARLRDMDNSVPMVFLDDYEELEPFDTLGYSATPGDAGLPTHSVSTFEHLCKLSAIADRILYSLYAEKSSQIDAEELFRTSQILHRDLTRWHESLPAHLSIDFDTSGRPNTSSGCVVLPHTLSLM
ncbi:Nitrogen assimilation transcription factor [Lachnellula subtilissima]|uniref:Nitrogen assimilation transcription factor n=1 Tax=Lachnellula subtilissima TaxID=602034 RepID=A0A8H8U6R9_9HELO|nr:Nitrogen assimilation transcription factor [Lachnellula subtilissima]